MRKITCIVLLTMLVGCGSMQNTDSIQPSPSNKQESMVKKQKEGKPDVNVKSVEAKAIYDGVFDEPKDPIIPETLTIDRIGVEATTEKVGKKKNGEMDVPKDYKNIGWFEPGTKPGEQGNAVMDGHVSDPEGEGVFWDLEKLEAGDEVKVADENGETLVFEVVDKQAFQLGEAPVNKIFGYTSRRALNLITCTGDFNYDKGTHEQRLVIFTELKEE